MVLHTIGHSTRPVDQTIDLLRAHDVVRVVDVRTVPGSRRNPQYGQLSLATSLSAAGIGYEHHKALGGLRRPSPHSRNVAWRNDSFRGYADYMQTEEFWRALQRLEDAATREAVAIMCAEALPWRCHRSLIADALVMHGWEVRHIESAARARPHTMTAFARIEAGRLVYDGGADTRLPFSQDR